MTKRQKAKKGLSLALRVLHDCERSASHYAKLLAQAKRDLHTHRAHVRLCTEDARRVGAL